MLFHYRCTAHYSVLVCTVIVSLQFAGSDNSADMASGAVVGAELATSPVIGGETALGSSPISGATPSSSGSKLAKNIDLLNNSGMGILKATKPYKREPLHRFVNFVKPIQ